MDICCRMKSTHYKLFFIIVYGLLFACGSKNTEVETQLNNNIDESNNDIDEPIVEEIFSLNFPEIKYNLIEIKSTNHLDEIKNKYINDTILGAAYRKTLRTLNRKELRFFRVGQKVIVPDTFFSDMRAYSIFPDEYKPAKYLDQIVMIDVEYQCYGCYEYGKLVRFAATNTGSKSSQTEPGKYHFSWKKREHKSSYDSTWIMPFTFNMHQYGTAMHQFVMPGRPVSHSCLRQFIDDAEWIYNWGKMPTRNETNTIIKKGSPVIVLNRFDYNIRVGGPWLNLTSNKSYYSKLPDNPLDVADAVITRKQPPIQKKETKKDLDTNN